MQQYVVRMAAWLEMVVGVIFITVPNVPCMLLFEAKPESIGRPLAHWVGVCLFALGIACLPSESGESQRNAVLGLFVFNTGAAALFTWVGAVATIHGPLLWPAATLHAVIAVTLLPRLLTASEWHPPSWPHEFTTNDRQ